MSGLIITAFPGAPFWDATGFEIGASVKDSPAFKAFKPSTIFSRELFTGPFNPHVFRLVLDQLKVFWPVIMFYGIFVMDHFRWEKHPSNLRLHNQTMFSYIALIIGERVVTFFDEHIPVFIKDHTAFPSTIFFKRASRLRNVFLRMFSSSIPMNFSHA